jgi:hypothetical protein
MDPKDAQSGDASGMAGMSPIREDITGRLFSARLCRRKVMQHTQRRVLVPVLPRLTGAALRIIAAALFWNLFCGSSMRRLVGIRRTAKLVRVETSRLRFSLMEHYVSHRCGAFPRSSGLTDATEAQGEKQ